MKVFFSQCVAIVLTMLIALCLTSCAGLSTYFLETSLDLSQKRFSGTSYESPLADNNDIGINVACLMMISLLGTDYVAPDKPDSFVPPANKYRKYQLAYAAPHTVNALERGKYYYRPSLSYPASTGKFIDHFSVLSGLEFIQKNSKYEGTKFRLNYLQVPVLAIYNYDLSDDRKVFGGLGPYFAFGVGGKIKDPGFSQKAFDKDLGFKRFDAGLTLTAGYKFNKKWSVRLAYDLGLANIEHESFDKTKNRTFSVNVGYWPQFIEKLLGR